MSERDDEKARELLDAITDCAGSAAAECFALATALRETAEAARRKEREACVAILNRWIEGTTFCGVTNEDLETARDEIVRRGDSGGGDG